ncbi:MAG: F0F1 ATP synthase subunit B [Ruminococcus sp.]|nr:F0F1 ATP synthase subunit B [Ruminococcus sp.]
MLNIDPWDIMWTVINLIILFLLLKKFLFGRVTAIMDRRAKMIQDDLDNAKKAGEEAEQLKAEYEDKLNDAHAQAVKITNDAKQRADRECNEMLEEARQDAAKIRSDAQKDIKLEREKAIEDAKSEIADLAVMAAQKVLEKNIEEQSNREYAQQLLSEVGAYDE